ncbi:MAG: trimeric intracellular cation channel family protein [Methylococcaceae bacterium]|nr:trimeric intracellular cation channel family protein [Methylococcaceae bacterium]
MSSEFSHVEIVLTVFMLIGAIASSTAGTLRAIESGMDVVGAALVAFIAANGGGTFRDILLNSDVFWMKHQYYIWISISVGLLVFTINYIKRDIVTHPQIAKILLFADAMGLAAFSIAGVEKALLFGQGHTIAVMMGVCTAVGGGIVVDVVSNRTPVVFSSEFYITVSIVGSTSYLFLHNWVSHPVAALLALAIMISFRVLSKYHRSLSL